jgi:hypothetical protein
MKVEELLRSRWARFVNATPLQPIKDAIEHAIGVHTGVMERRAAVATDGDLSAEGRVKAVRKYIAVDFAPKMRHATASIAAARKHLSDRGAKLLPPAPDKADLASAVLRSEMRAVFRDMSKAEKIKTVLTAPVDLSMIQAIIESPMLAGIDGIVVRDGLSIIDVLTDRYIDAVHPGQRAAITMAEEAIDLLSAAVTTAAGTIAAAGEFPSSKAVDDFIMESIGADKLAIIDREASRWLEPLAAAA